VIRSIATLLCEFSIPEPERVDRLAALNGRLRCKQQPLHRRVGFHAAIPRYEADNLRENLHVVGTRGNAEFLPDVRGCHKLAVSPRALGFYDGYMTVTLIRGCGGFIQFDPFMCWI
jgi:hypothetical protein